MEFVQIVEIVFIEFIQFYRHLYVMYNSSVYNRPGCFLSLGETKFVFALRLYRFLNRSECIFMRGQPI